MANVIQDDIDRRIEAIRKTCDLSNKKLTAKDAVQIAEFLANDTKLVYLNLCDNSIGDEGAVAISHALKKNRTLLTLNLTDNGIGDDGARAIVEALKENNTLSTLLIGFNRCGGVNAELLDLNAQRSSLTIVGAGRNPNPSYFIQEPSQKKVTSEFVSAALA